MNETVRLCDIAAGEHCFVSGLRATGGMRRRLLDIGLVENAKVTCLGRSPAGDPSAYLICGAVIAIRARDAHDVVVRYGL